MKEQYRVEISSDGSIARIVPYEKSQNDGLSHEDLHELLKRTGVVFGIVTPGNGLAAGTIKVDGPLVVARGTKPVDGKDGRVEILVETQAARPEGVDDARVDLRDLHFIRNVVAGQKLAVVHAPEKGTPGTSVLGKPVPPKPGRPAQYRIAKNTVFAPNDPGVVIATVNGNAVRTTTGSVEVQPEVVVHGNVDFSVGNIDFVGSLVVVGDVLGDFSVKVKKKLEVRGNVEDATLDVGEDAVIRQGFLGHGKGMLAAGGSVKIQHILNQTVVAGKDVVVEREAVNAKITAGNKIASPNATFAGGQLEADHEVEIHTAGSSDGSPLRIRVGKRARVLERIGQIEKELKTAERQIAEVNERVYQLIRLQIDQAGKLSEDKEALLAKAQACQKMLPLKIEGLKTEKASLSVDLQSTQTSRIKVHGTVFENVIIEINGIRKLVEAAMEGVIFMENGGTIESRPM